MSKKLFTFKEVESILVKMMFDVFLFINIEDEPESTLKYKAEGGVDIFIQENNKMLKMVWSDSKKKWIPQVDDEGSLIVSDDNIVSGFKGYQFDLIREALDLLKTTTVISMGTAELGSSKKNFFTQKYERVKKIDEKFSNLESLHNNKSNSNGESDS